MTVLPTKTSGGHRTPEELMYIFYGPPGIGKSQSATTFPNPLFISTNRGLGHLDVAKVDVRNWDTFIEACVELTTKKTPYRTLVFDLLKDLQDYCLEWCIENELDGKHPEDFDWGKGWGVVNKEFKRVISKLMDHGFCMIFIAHEDVREVKRRLVVEDKIVPKITKSVFTWLYGIVDIVAYMHMVERRKDPTDPKSKLIEERVMSLHPSAAYEAKAWMKGMPPEVVFQDSNVFDLIMRELKGRKK